MAKDRGPSAPRREVRTYPAAHPLTARTLKDGAKQIQGYAIVFNSRSTDLGGFIEICSPQMLTRTLKESPDVLALRDHKSELLLGRTTAGTLALNPDNKGLAFTITLPKTNIGDDTAENVRLRNLTGCSFGFVAVKDDWKVVNGQLTRTLLDIDLFEISVTSFPAYDATSVNTRSCPVALRSKLTKRDDDGLDDDEFCDELEQDADGSCPCDEDYEGDLDCDDDDDLRTLKLRLRLHQKIANLPTN
ncbi:MAG TPA: HK97 family phage prohead protease [Terracidiphilus sp.]|nr:HK97 family phage prohead protease [Terracidiphilus sp.]